MFGNFISNPNAALAFNIAQGGTSMLGSLFNLTGKRQGQSTALLMQSKTAFDSALDVQQRAIDSEVDLQNAQADLSILEAERDARLKVRDVQNFASQQELRYSASGIYLPGSPSALDVISDTILKGREEVNATMDRAQAQAKLMRMRAAQVQSQGTADILGKRSEFISSMLKARLADNEQGDATGPSQILRQLFQTSGAGVPRQRAARQRALPIPPPNTMLGTIHPRIGTTPPSLKP